MYTNVVIGIFLVSSKFGILRSLPVMQHFGDVDGV